MEELLNDVVYYAVYSALTVLIGFIINFVRNKNKGQKYATWLDLANIAVRTYEQTIGSSNGPLKKSKAVDWLVDVTGMQQDLAEHLIEASVHALNDGIVKAKTPTIPILQREANDQ